MSTALDQERGRIIEVCLELGLVDCSRHDDQLEWISCVLTRLHGCLENAEQDITVATTLVGFIDDNAAILLEQWVGLGYRME